MNSTRILSAFVGLVITLGMATPASAAIESDSADIAVAVVGPDIIVRDVLFLIQFGRVGPIGSGTVGLGMATKACNIGDAPGDWMGLPSTNHPVFFINLYRLQNVAGSSRFEQIGQSWLKHGTASASESGCGMVCISPNDNFKIGVGCADTYTAGQIATACDVAPRSIINPYQAIVPGGPALGAGGGCANNFPSKNHIGHVHDEISHRLQVRDVDLDPVLNAGARYFGEGHYFTSHEFTAANGAQDNNSSHREFTVQGPDVNGLFTFSEVGVTSDQSPALDAWSGAEQSLIEPAPLVDGRAFLAYKVTHLGAGQWHYEYVVYNMNLDRSIGALSIPIPTDVTVTNVGFHAPLHHAPELNAENYSNAPWSAVVASNNVSWSTTPFGTDPMANAVRYGTMYNFRFDANAPPAPAMADVGFFKTGTSMAVDIVAPAAVGVDCNGNSIDDRCDLDCNAAGCPVPGCGQSSDCTTDGIPDECQPDCNNNSSADVCDLAAQTSTDCNTNSIPDDCEPGGLTDCNNNGRADFCDILLGTSEDVNFNNVPDECELITQTYYVDDDACPGPGLGSYLQPFCKIMDAVNASASGDTVIVRDGTYTGTGNRNIRFGGREITVRSENGPENCVLETPGTGNHFFQFIDGELSEARLEGLTMRQVDEAAVYCVTGSPTIVNCVFRDIAPFYSGQVQGAPLAIFCSDSSPLIRACKFVNNTYSIGVGDFCYPIIEQGEFRDNKRHAVWCNANAEVTMDRTVVRGTQNPIYEVISLINCGGIITNSVFADNASPSLRLQDRYFILQGNTIVNNGGGIMIHYSTPLFTAVIEDSVIWGNAGAQISGNTATLAATTVRFSDVQGGWSGAGTGNVDVDPLFVDALSGDYHLSPSSPLRNVGNPAANPGSPDIDNEPRIADGRIDMGADEYNDCNSNGAPDYQDIAQATSADCDKNGIPDECESTTSDCNANLNWDACDLDSGTSQDCNRNGIPDECDIAALTSADCSGNGIPDECEHDCDLDLLVDSCEILLGAADCNLNGIPDSCELSATLQEDCNSNTRLDVCDISMALSLDDDQDGIPDECVSPLAAAAPNDQRKNRYISFSPNPDFGPRAYRVDKVTAPVGQCWVAAPDVNGNARCVAAPVTRVWPESVVHVGDCAIMPVAQYEVRATADGAVFGLPLLVETIAEPTINAKKWGDVVGVNAGSAWTPPNLITNVNDVLAVLAYITNAPVQPTFQQANLQSISSVDPCLNNFVNTADVLILVKAVAGDAYPFTTAPANCPVCP